MATKTTSASFYIAKAIESIQKIENLRYEINAMGTILESDNMDTINTATKQMMETVHNLGIARVEVIIKIDSRRDKDVKMEDKLDSIKKTDRLEFFQNIKMCISLCRNTANFFYHCC